MCEETDASLNAFTTWRSGAFLATEDEADVFTVEGDTVDELVYRIISLMEERGIEADLRSTEERSVGQERSLPGVWFRGDKFPLPLYLAEPWIYGELGLAAGLDYEKDTFTPSTHLGAGRTPRRNLSIKLP